MSNPYSRPTATQLRETAEAAASDAEIASITEGDSGREQLAVEYGHLQRETLSAAHGLPSEVKQRLTAYLDKLAAITTAGEQLRRGLPTPRLSSELASPYARQHTYDTGSAQAVMASAEQTVAEARASLVSEAEALTRAAWVGAVPPEPHPAMRPRVQANVAAIHAAVSGGAKPADILQRALDAGDDTLVYALLGSPEGRSLMTVTGADRTALARQYGEHLLARGGSFPGSAFLAAQQDETRSLAALRDRALAVYQAQRARAGAVLRTRVARGRAS